MRLLVALALLLASCGGAAVTAPPTWERPGLGGAVRPEMGSPQPGEVAPELVLPDLEGRPVSLASMRGSWVLVHFTATWCPFCDSEVEHLGALANALAPRGVKIVIIDVEEDARVWRDYAAAHVPPSVLALHDATGAGVARFAPPRAQPSFDDRAQVTLDATLLVDPAGVLRFYLMPDSAHFDPTFRAVREEVERLAAPPVVTAGATSLTVAAGDRVKLAVRLDVASGYHVMSDRPSAPTYVPTRVVVEGAPGVGVGAPAYPAPSSFAVADRTIATFAGGVEVQVPIDVAPDAAPGPRRLRVTVRYQACTASRCLFPATRSFDATLVVR
jgi:thiol-disulfide isomerase/thioredoxin